MNDYTVGSLFSGIGGIDLGLERAGFKVKWQSEIDPYSCRVLAKHWGDVPNLGDIKEVKWDEVERVDVIAGGYPCQPFSNAGQRLGEKDERHLWDDYCTAISVLRPRVAFLENVRGHYSLGFARVLGDLADIGYDAEWQIVSAHSVGAPHRRERLIALCYPTCERLKRSRRFLGQTTRGRFDLSSAESRWGNEWETEPSMARVANGVSRQVDRLRGLGNAVVPAVAEYVGYVICDLLEEQSDG